MDLRVTNPIPEIVIPILDRIQAYCQTRFNQMTVNCYESGHGIDPHCDHLTHFGPVIMGLSLGSPTTMIFPRTMIVGDIGMNLSMGFATFIGILVMVLRFANQLHDEE